MPICLMSTRSYRSRKAAALPKKSNYDIESLWLLRMEQEPHCLPPPVRKLFSSLTALSADRIRTSPKIGVLSSFWPGNKSVVMTVAIFRQTNY
jgi:hypothetical protein